MTFLEDYVQHAPELPECRARLRRFKAFLAVTEFVEVSVWPAFIAAVPPGFKDHPSSYRDPSGHSYLLCEPYEARRPASPPELACITVPAAIAPYGGGWTTVAGAPPGTIGILFTDVENSAALDRVAARLEIAAGAMPLWNSI